MFANLKKHAVRALALSATTLVWLGAASADPLRADHPMIGTWKLTLPQKHCLETYEMRADGSSSVTSADETSDSTFTISDAPSAKGYYRWEEKVTRTNGGKDCSGDAGKAGEQSTAYIVFFRSKNQFLMCEKEERETCVGPFVRAGSTADVPQPDAGTGDGQRGTPDRSPPPPRGY